MTNIAASLLRRAFPLLLAAGLAACAVPPEEDFGQCEPGVGELARTTEVCP